MKNLCLSMGLIFILGSYSFAADQIVKREASNIGQRAIDGAISGKKPEQIAEDAKKQAVDAAKNTANKKANQVIDKALK